MSCYNSIAVNNKVLAIKAFQLPFLKRLVKLEELN